jgi:hypothetical protein
VFFNSLKGVFGTAWVKAAAVAKKGADEPPIQVDKSFYAAFQKSMERWRQLIFMPRLR